jgi:hypothetical protein
MLRDIEAYNLPAVVSQDERYNSSRNVADATTNMSMAAMPIASLRKKAPPARRRRARSSHHVLADGGLTDLDTEFGQLAMDARCTPERVGVAHLPDQITHLAN